MPTHRTRIPEDLAAAVKFNSDHTCCCCNNANLTVQIHHIDENPRNHTIDNLAVLCLECHAKTQIRGGFGRKLNAPEVRKYHADWTRRVEKRRLVMDQIAVEATRRVVESKEDALDDFGTKEDHPRELIEVIDSLPIIRHAAYLIAREGLDSGNTIEMIDSSMLVMDSLYLCMTRLASFYPKGHFHSRDPMKYFREQIKHRARWKMLYLSTGGVGNSGTIVGPLVGFGITGEAESMIEEMAETLLFGGCIDPDPWFDAWREQWRKEC